MPARVIGPIELSPREAQVIVDELEARKLAMTVVDREEIITMAAIKSLLAKLRTAMHGVDTRRGGVCERMVAADIGLRPSDLGDSDDGGEE